MSVVNKISKDGFIIKRHNYFPLIDNGDTSRIIKPILIGCSKTEAIEIRNFLTNMIDKCHNDGDHISFVLYTTKEPSSPHPSIKAFDAPKKSRFRALKRIISI